MKPMKKTFGFLLPFVLLAETVRAHCPLCTMGVAAVAGGSVYFGVNKAVIGLFIGAFAVSTGWWAASWIKKTYVPHQKWLIIVSAFFLTVIPLLPIVKEVKPLYLPWIGTYGTTLSVNVALVTSIVGGLIVALSPALSKKISGLREGKILPFQGVVLTLVLLIVMGGLIQLVL